MCDNCDDDTTDRPAGIIVELIRAARVIEAAMPGAPAEEQAWEIFAGRAGGGIPWSDYQRILSSYEAAESAAKRSLKYRPRSVGRFRCEQANAGI